jgi:hypothetical protein
MPTGAVRVNALSQAPPWAVCAIAYVDLVTRRPRRRTSITRRLVRFHIKGGAEGAAVSSTRAPHTHLECYCGRRMRIAYVCSRHVQQPGTAGDPPQARSRLLPRAGWSNVVQPVHAGLLLRRGRGGRAAVPWWHAQERLAECDDVRRSVRRMPSRHVVLCGLGGGGAVGSRHLQQRAAAGDAP